MFTGIITEVGTVERVTSGDGLGSLQIACARSIADADVGDSISVNGCCLTVTALVTDGAGAPQGFTAELMGETLGRTALGALEPGSAVNLEPALRTGDRLGGHLVQGHVDGVGEVLSVRPEGAWRSVEIALPDGLSRYVVEKGSVTVQGASLTVIDAGRSSFSVGLIPHTIQVTALGGLQPGDVVNIEVDVLAKYVERLLRGGAASPYSSSQQEGT